METGKIVNESRGLELRAKPVAPFLMEMLRAGGLIRMAPRIANET
jgi:3-isopropylmalate/(R)-2-methylmalate dehydratase small subunit